MNRRSREATRDLAALLSVLAFVLGTGLALFFIVFYTFGPAVLGPLDQPVENRLVAVPVLLAFVVLFTFGALLGGVAWTIVMSRFLPKQTMYKWLTYGPQVEALQTFHLRLLDRQYPGDT